MDGAATSVDGEPVKENLNAYESVDKQNEEAGTSGDGEPVKENFNAYESVDKQNEEAGTSGDGEPARVDSPPPMPPVCAVVDKKSMKKETPTDEGRPASCEDNNAAPAAGPSTLPPLDPAVHKRPDSLTFASLDPVVLQPDSSKMRNRSHEETNYATIDMEKLLNDKI